jgi:hypothetical protein
MYLSIERNTLVEEQIERTYEVGRFNTLTENYPVELEILVSDLPDVDGFIEAGLPFLIDENNSIIVQTYTEITRYNANNNYAPEVIVTANEGDLILATSNYNQDHFLYLSGRINNDEFFEGNIQVYPSSYADTYAGLTAIDIEIPIPFIFMNLKDGIVYVSGPFVGKNYFAFDTSNNQLYEEFLAENLFSESQEGLFTQFLTVYQNQFYLFLLDAFELEEGNMFSRLATLIPLSYTAPQVEPEPEPNSNGRSGGSGSRTNKNLNNQDSTSLSYSQEVAEVLAREIITKEPASQTNKCEALVMMSRVFNWQMPSVSNTKFDDVPDWCVNVASFAVNRGVVQGRTATKLGMETPVTRDEIAVMLYRELKTLDYKFAGSEVVTFTDTLTQWAAEAITALAKESIIKGFANGEFGGQKQILKQDFGVMLLRLSSLL